MNVYEAALKTLAVVYRKDELTAGMSLAYLPGKECYYASVVRYPTSSTKKVVAQGSSTVSMGHAILLAMVGWTKIQRDVVSRAEELWTKKYSKEMQRAIKLAERES